MDCGVELMPDVSINIVGSGQPNKKFNEFVNMNDTGRRMPIYKVERLQESLLKRIKNFLINGIARNE